MKIGTVLIAAIMAGVSLPALGQTNNQTDNSNRALAECVRAADQKYKDTWVSLCGRQMAKVGYCGEFIESIVGDRHVILPTAASSRTSSRSQATNSLTITRSAERGATSTK